MTDHPDDVTLDATHAAMTATTRKRQRSSVVEMSLVATASILMASSTLFSAWNTFELRKLHQDSVEIRRLTLLGTECIVEQLAEHRHLSALSNRANAAHHGYTYPIEAGSEPPVIPGALEAVCQIFLHTTTTSVP